MGRLARSQITGLNVKEEAFAQGLAKGLNQAQAYNEAYGVGTRKPKSTDEKASKLKTKVQSRVAQLIRETAERSTIKRDEIVDWLKTIAEVGMERVQIVDTKTTFENGRTVERVEERHLDKLVDASGANSAIEKLIKMQGLFAAEKVETEVKTKGKFVLNLNERTDKNA